MKRKVIVLFTTCISFISVFTIIVTSCTKDEVLVNKPSTSGKPDVINGFLNFRTSSDLKTYLNDVVKEKKSNVRKVMAFNNGSSFVSLQDLKERGCIGGIKKSIAIDTDEEMTVDEYRINNAEELLKDPLLNYVVDTTLRIGVEDRLYKVTHWGTFISSINSESLLVEKINNFETLKADLVLISDNYYQLADGVYFVDTYHLIQEETVSIDSTNTSAGILSAKSSSIKSDNNDYFYSLKSYSWESKTLVGKALSKLFGTDAARENYFSDSRRIKVELFDVDYKFYTSTGLKVKMQKRKKFLGIPYWTSSHADKIAIGIEQLDAKITLTAPPSNIQPLNKDNYGTFTGSLNNYIVGYVFKGLVKLDFLDDWASDVLSFVGFIDYLPTSLQNSIYNYAPSSEVYSFLKSLNNRYIFAPIEKQIKPDDPRTSLLMWGQSSEIKQFVTGIREFSDYDDTDGKTIRFNQSFGFSYSSNGDTRKFTGYLPVKMSIEKVKIFGAAYDSGIWKGIRFEKK